MRSRAGPSFTATTLALWSTLLTWAAYFLLVYVGIAVACERGFADERIIGLRILPTLVVTAFVVALAVTGVLARAAWRRRHAADAPARQFLPFVALVLALLVLAGIVWTTLPPVLLDTGCA